MTDTLFLICWLIAGLIGGGFLFAFSQGHWPEISKEGLRVDLCFSLFVSLFGVATLVVGFLFSGFGKHGWWIWFKKENKTGDST